MSAPKGGVGFDGGEIEAFLDQISRDEAREISRLREACEAEARAVRTESRRASIQFHHRVAEETRTRMESDQRRKLSRARAEFRRRRWQVLLALREQAREKIQAALFKRWREPNHQLAWCLHWLGECYRLGDGAAVEVRLGQGSLDASAEAIERIVARSTIPGTVIRDDDLGAGLEIRHGTRYVDGLLETQLGRLLDAVDRDLAAFLHADTSHGGGGA